MQQDGMQLGLDVQPSRCPSGCVFYSQGHYPFSPKYELIGNKSCLEIDVCLLPTYACCAAIGHDPFSPKYERDGYQTVLTRWVVPACAILGFVFMLNHQRYWRHHEFWATAMFTLPIVMLPAIRCAFGWGGGMR